MRRAAHHGGAGVGLRRGTAARGLAVFALAVIGIAIWGSGSDTREPALASVAPRAAQAGPRPRGPTRPRQVHSPAASALSAALLRQFRLAGPDSGAEVIDLGASAELFTLRDGVRRPPASVEKLYTTAALLDKLGPNTRLRTTVLGAGFLGPGGVWHGNLYLRGGGDPTFGDSTFNRTWEQGYGPTANQLVSQLQRKGIRRVTGSVIGDESMFDARRGGPGTKYAPDTPDYGGQLSALTYDHGSTSPGLSPGAFAAKELTLTLNTAHVQAKAAKRTGRTPRRARMLATVSSPPLSVLLSLMDVPSDDLFADLFTKQLGARFGGSGSITAGARVIRRTIHDSYDLNPSIIDGSGLSRKDRSSPREIVALLRDVWGTPVGAHLSASLPVVGVSGTVRTIATGTAAQGHCIAKTGTLNNVTNLAGYCHSRGNHLLSFALLVDGPSNGDALVLLSRMVAAIARY
jgi:D-alanyl-D-alanine carboxypeptidase/D-alanyl-D-alanine-endopeptidase (penicillin-binding protein 4)